MSDEFKDALSLFRATADAMHKMHVVDVYPGYFRKIIGKAKALSGLSEEEFDRRMMLELERGHLDHLDLKSLFGSMACDAGHIVYDATHPNDFYQLPGDCVDIAVSALLILRRAQDGGAS